jgi:hypothetical protein
LSPICIPIPLLDAASHQPKLITDLDDEVYIGRRHENYSDLI